MLKINRLHQFDSFLSPLRQLRLRVDHDRAGQIQWVKL